MPDAFDTLQLPARFDLAPQDIQRAYLARAAALARETDEAVAAALNSARMTLEDPEKRASALLLRLGGPAKEADRSLPDGFLLEMMDVREQIAAAHADAGAIDKWEDWGEHRRQIHIEAVGRLFANIGAAAPERAALLAIRRELNAWRYIERLIEQLHARDDGAM